jgi:hypothetical protein
LFVEGKITERSLERNIKNKKMSDVTVELPVPKPQIIDTLEVNRGTSDLRKNRKAVISTQMRS